MPRYGPSVVLATMIGFLLTAAVVAADPVVNRSDASPPALSPRQDDADLHDLQFVGRRIGWAIGDRGVIRHTADGGRTWSLVACPVTCPLRSVCFLTDRVGWIVGGGTTPYTRQGYGVVLFTNDGGMTWHQPATDPLPRLHWVKFFGMRDGVAVGDVSTQYPTGVLVTKDGGKTWRPIVGRKTGGWRTADFLSPEIGAVAGTNGHVAMVGGGKLLSPRLEPLGLRGLRDVRLRSDGTGWLVGDGGLVLRTDNGGVVWQEPSRPLPIGLRDTVDFRAVSVRGEKVWIAGAPGSVVWHSPDGGRSWSKQITGQTVPIHTLNFTSDTVGWAAGAMGMLLKTEDAGETWKPVLGGGRRAAYLAVHARPEQVSFPLLAEQSGELGYRGVVLLPARRDHGPDGHFGRDLDVRLHEAVSAAGGSGAEVDWRFPLAIPGLEQNKQALVADWNRRTEGRLGRILLARLVARLRTWRPSVVIIDEPAANDATARLLNEALRHAIEQAADPTRFVEQHELTALDPWQVRKVYRRLPPGSTGHAHVDPYRHLLRLGMPVQSAAGPAAARLLPNSTQAATRHSYRLVLNMTSAKDSDFFNGLRLTPGSDARRQLTAMDDHNLELHKKLADRQRNFRAIAGKVLDDDRKSAQLIAELQRFTRDLPDDQAAFALVQLADDYRRRSRWSLVEATLVELVERYPDQPASHAGMQWLLQYWTGSEPAWQRARAVRVGRTNLSVDAGTVRERIERATYLAAADSQRDSGSQTDSASDSLQITNSSGALKIDRNADWRSGSVQHWHRQALRMAGLMRRQSPAFFSSAETQFPLAALLRSQGAHRSADEAFRRFARGGAGDAWKQTADTELWLLNPTGEPPKSVAVCRRASEPPFLDGLLSDTCWQNAKSIRLRSGVDEDDADGRRDFPLVMLSYDDKYLYLAASLPRADGFRTDPPEQAGRTHDADLSAFDRVSLYLDLDRDYATYYTLTVDQRGWTAEACWEDWSWNPRWHVAADADRTHWRIEAAIPIRELSPVAPTRRSLWAMGLVRTTPTVGVAGWTLPASTRPRPETFGLLRFD